MTQNFQVLVGVTGVRLQVFLRDSSVNYQKGLAGLTNSSAGLTAYYFRDGDTTPTALSLVTATVGTFTSGGFKEISSANMPGLYEVGIPNATLASGSRWVKIILRGATNLADTLIQIDLLGNDPFAAALSSGANTGIASAFLGSSVESGVTVQQMLRAIGASVAGNYDSATGTFKAVSNGSTTRLTTTLASNNRSVTPSL